MELEWGKTYKYIDNKCVFIGYTDKRKDQVYAIIQKPTKFPSVSILYAQSLKELETE